MKNLKKYLLLFGLLTLAGSVYAVQITVPSATNSGMALISTSTGAYVATTTDPLHVGSLYSTSTASSVFNGPVSSLSVTTGGLNHIIFVPETYNSANCAASSTASTYQNCVQALIKAEADRGASGVTVITSHNVSPSDWTGQLSLTQPGIAINFICTGSAQLVYGGPNLTDAIKIDNWNSYGHVHQEFAGCQVVEQATLIHAGDTNTRQTVGLYLGGPTGAVGWNIHDNTFNGFGTNWEIGANAYMLTFTHNSNSGGNGTTTGRGSLVQINISSNSGEANTFIDNKFTDPGNSLVNCAINIVNGATASNFFSYGSIDDVQMCVGSSNGLTAFDHFHIENSDTAHYGQYIPILGVSSDRSTQISMDKIEVANDGGGANSFKTIIKHGGQLDARGIHIDNYGGGTIDQFSDHSLDNGVESENICQIQVNGGALTNIIGGSGGVPYTRATGATCVTNVDNSYTIGLRAMATNVNEFFSGGTTVGTFDHSGNWTFLNNGSFGGTLGVTGLATFSAAATIGTNLGVGTTSFSTIGMAPSGNVAITGVVTIGSSTPLQQYPNNPLNVSGNTNGYVGATVINGTCGTAGSADWLVNNDLSRTVGGVTSYISDFGENSSCNTSGGFLGDANGGYLFPSDGSLSIEAASTTNTSAYTRFGTGGVEAMRITNPGDGVTVGRIGIGTIIPRAALDVQTNTSGAGVVSIQNRSASGYSSLDFYDDAGTHIGGFGNGNTSTGAGYSDLFYFGTNGPLQDITFRPNDTEALRIKYGGYVGVGTTTPRFALTSASSTAPQLALSSGTGVSQWVFRTLNDGTLAIATTTIAGTATSSVSALRIDATGKIIANCFSTNGSTCIGNTGTVTSVATDATLTGGTITTTGTLGLNLANANIWTSLQQFNGQASSTGFSANFGAFGSSATTTITAAGFLGYGTTSPVDSITSTGSILATESTISTSSSMTIDTTTTNQPNIRVGSAAVTINFNKYVAGSSWKTWVCNPAGAPGAITWDSHIIWTGNTAVAPTQTTTANVCDLYTFNATNGTSTLFIAGAQIPNF